MGDRQEKGKIHNWRWVNSRDERRKWCEKNYR